jgi:hypothetical protein
MVCDVLLVLGTNLLAKGGPAMLKSLAARVKRSREPAVAAAEQALFYLVAYGLPILLLTCLLIGLILLV